MAAKKMPWKKADAAASTILETTYPPVLAIVISVIVMKTSWTRGGIHEARLWTSLGPAPAK